MKEETKSRNPIPNFVEICGLAFDIERKREINKLRQRRRKT
jgi:hypothetical protein